MTRYVEFKDAIELAEDSVKRQHEVLIVASSDSTYYAVGVQPNTTTIGDNHDNTYYGQYNGGCCVIFPGDISINEISRKKTNTGLTIINAVKQFLVNKEINCIIDNNDLVIDGIYKVGSWAQTQLNLGLWQTVVHLSVNVDLDVINQVCTKETNKTPKGLSDYNITYSDLFDVINTVL